MESWGTFSPDDYYLWAYTTAIPKKLINFTLRVQLGRSSLDDLADIAVYLLREAHGTAAKAARKISVDSTLLHDIYFLCHRTPILRQNCAIAHELG